VRNARTMTVIMSTASLEHAVYPLDKALVGAVLGMEVNVVFEGAAVRPLKRGYRPRSSGLAEGAFTAIWPYPPWYMSRARPTGMPATRIVASQTNPGCACRKPVPPGHMRRSTPSASSRVWRRAAGAGRAGGAMIFGLWA